MSQLEIEDQVQTDLQRATGLAETGSEATRLNRVLQLTGEPCLLSCLLPPFLLLKPDCLKLVPLFCDHTDASGNHISRCCVCFFQAESQNKQHNGQEVQDDLADVSHPLDLPPIWCHIESSFKACLSECVRGSKPSAAASIACPLRCIHKKIFERMVWVNVQDT